MDTVKALFTLLTTGESQCVVSGLGSSAAKQAADWVYNSDKKGAVGALFFAFRAQSKPPPTAARRT